jgi:hypothetical protein
LAGIIHVCPRVLDEAHRICFCQLAPNLLLPTRGEGEESFRFERQSRHEAAAQEKPHTAIPPTPLRVSYDDDLLAHCCLRTSTLFEGHFHTHKLRQTLPVLSGFGLHPVRACDFGAGCLHEVFTNRSGLVADASGRSRLVCLHELLKCLHSPISQIQQAQEKSGIALSVALICCLIFVYLRFDIDCFTFVHCLCICQPGPAFSASANNRESYDRRTGSPLASINCFRLVDIKRRTALFWR